MPYNGNEESDFCGYQYYIEILANFTKKHNYTQDALARKLNISRQAISKWETGTAIPDLEILLKITDFETTRSNIGRIRIETVENMQNQIISMVNLQAIEKI